MPVKRTLLLFIIILFPFTAHSQDLNKAKKNGVAAAKNWPSFRGRFASGIADGQNPPATWDAEKSLNIKWKTPVPGLAHSSPIVWDDRVFITTAISSDTSAKLRVGLYGDVAPDKDVSKHTWKVYCLDKKTGKIIWERTAYEGAPKVKRHPKATQANSTPAADGKYVVVLFGAEGLYCYDFNGKLIWQKDLGVLDAGWFYDPDYQWGYGSSPIIYKNLVIVQCDIQKNSFIAAYDIKTGKRVWLTPRDEIPSWGTPTIHEGKARVELIANGTGHIRGYDPMTGKELWKLAGNSEITTPTPFVAHDLIFVTSGYRPIQPIYAIRVGATGDISLKENEEANAYIAWSKKRGGPYMPTPVVYGDYLYICANNGTVTCYDAKTGEQIYRERLGGRGKGYAFTASPVAADGKLYFTSEDGEVYVVKAGPQYELIATNSMGEICMATPAISDGMIFIRTQNHVYAIGE
jgi:outer membrane protein assembly factor BamB